ncbi:hypothetical protein [Micromonospora sp. NBRC 101691]|uniref:hypothetical protein n=1 Tax=Micromonospora sp. NBRC 101691 TaxID=3032198 RepID=UPI00249FBB84|nr:hypothetical protein [Micromonospora sp. NBRC 101691]GLY22809.1 hypothetical protein Misp04_25410 [Micromonospora sp. NBRC 101691]
MAGIPWAREKLDRAAIILRDTMAHLVRLLEPDQQPEIDLLPEPAILDWQEPLRHAYTATVTLTARKHRSAAHAVRHGADLLSGWGWAVEEETGPAETRTVARRDGFVISLYAFGRQPGVSHRGDGYGISGQTPHVLLYEPVGFVPPEPIVTADALPNGALLCYECDGLGWCPCCLGRGFTLDDDRRRQRCQLCFTRRICPICEGTGLKWIHALNSWERGQYPELGSD